MKALLALAALPVILWAQSEPPPLIGTVTAVDAAAYSITVKDDKTGVERTVLLQDAQTLLKVPPGAKVMDGAVPITASDIVAGDRVDVEGPKLYGNPNTISAKNLILMSGSELRETLGATHQDVPSPQVPPAPVIDPFPQSSSPVFKNHRLGESVRDYLSQTRGGSEYLEGCERATSKKIAHKVGVDLAVCETLRSAIERGARFSTRFSSFDPDVQPTPLDKATLEGGRLVSFSFEIGEDRALLLNISPEVAPARITYDQVLADVIEKIGEPTSTHVLNTQNGYGATFQYRSAFWRQPSLFAEILEVGTDVSAPVTSVEISTPEEHAKETGADQPRANSLN